MANALALGSSASIDALAWRTSELCVPMSERARASAVYSIKQRTLYLAFAKPPSPCAAMLAGCDGGVGQRDCPSVPLLRFAKWRGARRSALQWCKGERRPLLWGGRGVRERCSRAEGGLSPKALAKPPSTREAGRAARRFPSCCAGSTSSRAGCRPARRLCARRPQAPPACTCRRRQILQQRRFRRSSNYSFFASVTFSPFLAISGMVMAFAGHASTQLRHFVHSLQAASESSG